MAFAIICIHKQLLGARHENCKIFAEKKMVGNHGEQVDGVFHQSQPNMVDCFMQNSDPL